MKKTITDGEAPQCTQKLKWMDWTGLDPSGPPRAPCGANKQGPCQGAGKEGRG